MVEPLAPISREEAVSVWPPIIARDRPAVGSETLKLDVSELDVMEGIHRFFDHRLRGCAIESRWLVSLGDNSAVRMRGSRRRTILWN